jgi:hypothetical protein
MRAKKIDTSHFTDAQYMTAQQKRRVLGDWVRFFENGMVLKRYAEPPVMRSWSLQSL